MQIQEPLPNHKTYNMYTSTLVKNQIPSFIEMFKLQTHQDLILNNKLHRYVTNILIASHNWIKLFVMFQHDHIHEVYERDVFDHIRSLTQMDRSILVEVDHKLFSLAYEPGNLKTVAMASLEFIRLRPKYRSFIRVDSFRKYSVMIAGDYLLFILSARCKQLGILAQMPIFQKTIDEVKWHHPDHNYFNSIYYTKITKPYFKQIIDIQLDKSNLYMLVLQKGEHFIYTMNFSTLKPEDTADTIFKKKYTLSTTCYKLTVLTPETDSSLLVFTQKMIYHLSLDQEKPITELTLPDNNDFSTLKVRWFNPTNVYYKDATCINVVRVIGNRLERTIVNNVVANQFCMTTVSINGCLVYLSEGRCMIETFEGKKCIHTWLNSLIDFHIGRTILAVECQGQKFLKNGKENNRVIAIKRTFRPIDKITANSKKSFIEGLMPFDSISSLGNTKILVIKTQKQKVLYRDTQTLTKIQIKDIDEIFDVKYNGKNEFAVLSQNKLTLYDENQKNLWQVEKIQGRLFDCRGELFVAENNGQLTVVNFSNKKVHKFRQFPSKNIIKIYITSKQHSFTKRNFNQPHPHQDTRYLLYSCSSSQFFIHALRPQSETLILVWKTLKVSSGPAFLANILTKTSKAQFDLEQYKSISDPHYVVNNLVPPTIPKESKYTIVDFKLINLPSQTILVFMNSNNQCFLYKQTLTENCVGVLYRKIILPLHTSKVLQQSPFLQYTPQLFRFGSRLLYDDVILDVAESFKHCFILGGELWVIGNDNRIRLADIKGVKISGKLVHVITQNGSYHSIQSSPEYYACFTRQTIEFYDKDFTYKNKVSIKSPKTVHINNQEILMAKIFQSHCAISSYQYFKSSTQNFQSYKFLFSVYDIKDKTRTQALILQEPAVSIRFTRPGRIVFATSSLISICEVKSNKLQIIKTISYSLRGFLGNMSYWKQSKQSNTSSLHFMAFAGALDGLSFAGFDDQKLLFKEKWFQPLPFGARDVQIFLFGTSLKALIVDNDKNVIVMDLKQNECTKIADFHVGTLVNKLIKVQDSTRSSELIYGCCADGTIRVFTAIKRLGSSSLRRFQKLIYEQLPTVGGLTLEFRRLKQENRSYKVGCQGNMVEVSTLELFQSLSQELRSALIEKSQYQQQDIQLVISKNCIF